MYTHVCIVDREPVAIGKVIRTTAYGNWYELHGQYSGKFIGHENDLMLPPPPRERCRRGERRGAR